MEEFDWTIFANENFLRHLNFDRPTGYGVFGD